MKFRIRTRELELSKALDEVFLRLFLMAMRLFQVVCSIPIIGFAAAFISALSSEDQNVPSKLSAALAIACVCTVYTGLTLLPIIFGGPVFFTVAAVFDGLFVAAWSSLIGVWDNDGTATCHAFINKYFDSRPQKSYFSTDCKLVKAMFAFLIINLAAFTASAVVAFCLRLIELEHTMSWRSLPLFNKRDERERHCACCNHDKYHPSPPASISHEPLTSSV
ncbi:uncharacterized protein PV06_00747 [Exophiala oligosperma]|uniref:MARVEL domain-containing protein n=2 Tax=Chaetothyriales TaxID=34395 RepID=A0A0D2DYG1_9EURO|nr:uncharacterized protein PV06_00747 [Exophiala oligosperma]KIW48128.1 hypothetical protein PV06_00747 [Exophiala oligosperma]